MNKIGYVYMVTCIITGRIYIGSSVDPYGRFADYKQLNCKHQRKLYNSLKKYGPENHKCEIIWTGDLSEMLEKECILGNFYEVLDYHKGLNLLLPKIGDVYESMSQETRDKMSKSHTGKIIPEEARKNMSIAWHNSPTKDKRTKNLQETNKGRIRDEIFRKNLSNIKKLLFRKKVINLITKEVYDSSDEVAVIVGIVPEYMRKILSGKMPSKRLSYLMYYDKYLELQNILSLIQNKF